MSKEQETALHDQPSELRRTITIDLDTGEWVWPTTLTPGDGARVAAAVLPGWPAEDVNKAYGEWLDDIAEETPATPSLGDMFQPDEFVGGLSRVVFEALGAASVCWENMAGAGVFDSTRARQIGEELLDSIREHFNTVDNPEAAVQELVHNAGTGLEFLLGMQLQIESAWGRQVDPEDPEAVSKYVREVILCTTDELHEVLAEVHWKPWKDKRGIKDMDKYREEMADVLHFILDLYLAAGLTGKDIVLDYMAKHYENLDRNRSAEYKAS